MGAAGPDARPSLGHRPRQERDDCQRCAARCTGRNGSRGVPQTSRNCVICIFVSINIFSFSVCVNMHILLPGINIHSLLCGLLVCDMWTSLSLQVICKIHKILRVIHRLGGYHRSLIVRN